MEGGPVRSGRVDGFVQEVSRVIVLGLQPAGAELLLIDSPSSLYTASDEQFAARDEHS